MARPRYGWDRPDLTLLSLVAVVFWFAFGSLVYAYSSFPYPVRLATLAIGIAIGLAGLFTAASFTASSLVTKFRQRDRLLDLVGWAGARNVLDVGCGPGLLLVGAAKRAPEAKVVGVDLWRRRVESGNSPERALENARVEGVADRVEVKDGDARSLPFPDSCFDVVLCRAVLHNLKGDEERRAAIREMCRVLRPGGDLGLVLVDSWHLREYTSLLQENGARVEKVVNPPKFYPPGLALLTILVGRKAPATKP